MTYSYASPMFANCNFTVNRSGRGRDWVPSLTPLPPEMKLLLITNPTPI